MCCTAQVQSEILPTDAQQKWHCFNKERPTPHDSVEQRCTNHSRQVMPLFGTQLCNSCYRYMVNDRKVKVPV